MNYEALKTAMGCDHFYSEVTEELAAITVDKWYANQFGVWVLGVNTPQPQLASKEVLPSAE